LNDLCAQTQQISPVFDCGSILRNISHLAKKLQKQSYIKEHHQFGIAFEIMKRYKKATKHMSHRLTKNKNKTAQQV
jgi:uncharacterized protein YutD